MKSIEIRSISGPYFTVFSPNTENNGPEKTLYLKNFHAVKGYIQNRIYY